MLTRTIAGQTYYGSVEGTVVIAGKGVQDVKVTPSHDVVPVLEPELTDEKGRFLLSNLPSGQIHVVACKVGNAIKAGDGSPTDFVQVFYGVSEIGINGDKPKKLDPPIQLGVIKEKKSIPHCIGSKAQKGSERSDAGPDKTTGKEFAVSWGSALSFDDLSGQAASVLPSLIDVSGITQTTKGTALADVRVAVVNADNARVISETSTGRDGRYSVSLYEAGTYFFVFSQPGYREAQFLVQISADGSHEFSKIDEQVQPPLTVTLYANSEKSPGGQIAAPQVETLEATQRKVFSPPLTETLPLPGFRTFDYLAFLAPGVLPPPQTNGRPGPSVSPGIGSAGQFAVNGLRSRDNNFNIDGSDNNDEEIGARRQGFVNLVPQAVESVKEFQVITALGDSRFGRSIGGQVNVLTKSGSKELHGQMYDFFNDHRLNARDFFDNFGQGVSSAQLSAPEAVLEGQPLNLIPPPDSRTPKTLNQWGGSVGGPLRVGSQTTYFFTSFEQKVRNASQNDYFAVPTPNQRGFQGNEVPMLQAPGSSFFASSLPGDAVFSLFPFPNDPTGPYGPNTFATTLPASGNGSVYSAQVDHQLKTGSLYHAVTVRYNGTNEGSVLPVTGGAIYSSVRPRLATQNLALLVNTNITARHANSFRASYGRTSAHFDEIRSPYLSAPSLYPGSPFLLNAPLLLNVTSAENPAALPTYISASSAQGQQLLSGVGLPSGAQTTDQITGALGEVQIAGFSPLGVDTLHFPQKNAHNTVEVGDTFTYVRGRHVLSAGTDIRRVALNSSVERGARPYALFGGLGTSGLQDGGPNATQGFLSPATLAAAGVPSGLFQTLAALPNFSFFPTRKQVDLFLQDEIRATNNLRFDIGFRLELNRLPEGIPRQRLEGFNPDLKVPVDFQTTFGQDRVGNDPRVGFAWDVKGDGRTAIRGGFAVYTGQFPMIVLDESQSNAPYFLPLNIATFPSTVYGPFLVNLANPASPGVASQFGGFMPGTLSILNSEAAIDTVGLLSGNGALASFNPGLDLMQPGPRIKNPYGYHYALTVERQLLPDTVLSIGFVGTQGRKLLRVSTPNRGFDRAAVQISDVNPLRVPSQFPDFLGSLTSAQGTTFQGTKTRTFSAAQELWEGTGTSSYGSLQAEVRRRYTKDLEFGSAFTYSHTLDDTSDFFDTAGEFALAQDSVQRSERGPASFDAPLRSVSYLVFDLPYLGSKKGLGGWQLSGVYTAQSGQPFTVNSVFDVNQDGNLTDRLNTTRGLLVGPAAGSKQTRISVLSGTSLESLLSPRGSDGSVGRNTFRAQGINDLDFSVTKTFRVSENHRLQARGEIFNGLNRTHFGIPVRILEFPAFGKSVSTTVPARTIQLALKYNF